MKKRVNTNGLGLSNRRVMNEDRISELPDALLLQILSSVPTETAIATSVLSKRWRSLWKMVPKLKFDCTVHQIFDNIDPHIFSENVYKTLALHKSPVLESLHLIFHGRTECLDVGIWIATAFARRVRKLVLDSIDDDGHTVILPSVLLSYNDTLETLELDDGIDLEFPSQVCLKSLRKLYLYRVHFKDDESVCNLLCGCPCLEDLVIQRDLGEEGTFTIAVPSLQRLTIEGSYRYSGGDDVGGYVINSPSLKYLKLKWVHDLAFIMIENAPELVEAKVTEVHDIDNENILLSLTSAKRLSLHLGGSFEIKYPPTGQIFYQLQSLELRTNGAEWLNLLSLMLDSSPKLQILKLINKCFSDKDSPIGRRWNQPKCVPECLLLHLETFAWEGYGWEREDDKEVATYILKNARCLKKATLSTKDIESINLKKLEKRREMLKELASVVRASDSCHLVCEDED